MCGIIGFSGSAFSKKDLIIGLKNIKHRGPDETISFSTRENSYLGMVRLAIRDITKDLYPFEFKHLSLIYNGEIYNQDKIQKVLLKKIGYQCQTSCDAEVILPLYDQYGPVVFEILQGMFAIAIYDNQKKQIIISRDIFGEKPLYYYYDKKSFFFASELSALPKKIKNVSSKALYNYLSMGFNPAPETFFKNIYKVEPGQIIIFDTKSKKVNKLNFNPIDKILSQPSLIDLSSNQKILKLEETLESIIKSKIVSDVPIGTFLSGGVDSSLITALVQKELKTPIKTFSISFNEKSANESMYSKIVAKHLQTDHHEIKFTELDIKKNWKKIIEKMDEPICDPALFPTFLLAEYASKFCPVILTGEGADEIFSGYSHYQKKSINCKFLNFLKSLIPKKILKFIPYFKIYKLLTFPQHSYTSVNYPTLWFEGQSTRKKYQKIIRQSWKNNHLHKNNYSSTLKLQRYDLHHYVSEQLCMKMDKMTMQHSIESRAPFLDKKLLPFMKESADLTEQRKPTKFLLKEVAKKYLPNEIVWRKKHGFSLPLAEILNGPLKTEVSSLSNPHPLLKKVISPKTIEKIVNKFKNGNKKYNLPLWNLVTLQAWLKATSVQK
jgi:asparagine synthase (glutamine-hydrolysing)